MHYHISSTYEILSYQWNPFFSSISIHTFINVYLLVLNVDDVSALVVIIDEIIFHSSLFEVLPASIIEQPWATDKKCKQTNNAYVFFYIQFIKQGEEISFRNSVW